MRQSNKMGRDWLRIAILAGCIPAGSSIAQDRFIHQPKPVKPAPQQVQAEQPLAVKENPTASQYTAIQPPITRDEAPRVPATLSSAPRPAAPELELNDPEPAEFAAMEPQPTPLPSLQVSGDGRTDDRQGLPIAAPLPAPAAPAQARLPVPTTTFRPVQPGAVSKADQAQQNLSQQIPPQSLATHLNSTPPNQSRHGLKWVAKGTSPTITSEREAAMPTVTQHQFTATPPASHDFPSLSTNYPAPEQAYRAPEASQSQQRFSEMETRMQELETKFTKALAERERKPTVATLVSSTIVNDPRYKVDAGERRVISPVETPTGWQAIGQQLAERLSKCEGLLGRGAFYSAREEAETATLILLRHLDLMDNSYRCEPTLAAAHQAMREAEDFVAAQRSSSDTELVKRLIDAHETSLLKGVALEDTSPATAAQHYRQYAEQLLAQAALNHPWASELYYATGRAYQAEADVNKADSAALRARALCYYRAARITLPTNAIACNQLGFLLLQMDRPVDAREAIMAALAQRGDTTFLSNLAEASRRLGDTATQQWALQTVASRNAGQAPAQKVPQVLELTPAQFAELSPYASSPNMGAQPPATEAAPPAQMHRTATAPMSSNLR